MPRLTIAPLLVVLAVGCDSKNEAKPEDSAPAASKAAGSAAGSKAAAKPEPEAALPTETETLALDEGDSAIPAIIEVPKGCTTFNDSPTQIRISYDKGELFGVQVHQGNEFNTNLDETEKMMAKSEYSK